MITWMVLALEPLQHWYWMASGLQRFRLSPPSCVSCILPEKLVLGCRSHSAQSSLATNQDSVGIQERARVFPKCCKTRARSRLGFPLVEVTEEVSRAERRLLPQDDPARQPPCFSLISVSALDHHPPSTLVWATK
jgi:hypothetical protein